MDKLRVDSGIKKIEVNDNGEYISIPISDTAFYERLGVLIRNFEHKQKEVEQKAEALAEKHKDKPDDDAGAIADIAQLYSELCRYICAEIDGLFGAECCRKVFVGVENPSVELIADFLEQITSLINQYAAERNQKINLMYSRNRKGARSK